MTNSEGRTRLSVRGEAEQSAAADQATILTSVTAVADTKQAARAAVTAVVAGVSAGLAEVGGQVLTEHNARSPLTWLAQSIRTSAEFQPDPATGVGARTGRHVAELSVVIAVRDFALLGRVEVVLTSDDAVSLHHVQWSVDTDNPAWAIVRANAIQAALRKGQDYAAALGGRVVSVEHVADAGLLDGATPAAGVAYAARATRLSSGNEAASLDPAPQVLTAAVEVRVVAEIDVHFIGTD